MGVKTGVEAADIGCCEHIIRVAVLVCHNSLREEGQPQFHTGDGHVDFLAVTPCLGVCCYCELGVLDLVNATDVLVNIHEITLSFFLCCLRVTYIVVAYQYTARAGYKKTPKKRAMCTCIIFTSVHATTGAQKKKRKEKKDKTVA